MSEIVPILIIVVVAILAFVAGALIARRKGYNRPGEVVARCRRGHLFTTVWSAKASGRRVDLGWARIQRCPVGDHLTIVFPVRNTDLTAEQRKEARKYRDEAAGSRP
jgi:hypothetical protein